LLWYGVTKFNWQNKVRNLKLRNKLLTRTNGIVIENKINFSFSKTLIHVPYSWNIVFIKIKNNNNYVLGYSYSDTYFFFIPLALNLNNFYFDKKTKVILINCLYKNNFFNTYWSSFKNIFFSFSRVFFKKLKFKGKGYYIYKNYRNTIATQFGHSHMSRLYNFNVGLKFISKTMILLYGLSKVDIFLKGKAFYWKKPINIFTGRGVRFSKQIIYKKTGKISSYR